MYYEAPSGEMKKEMIERMARFLVDNGLDNIATLFLNTFMPLAYIGSQLSLGLFYPFLILFGDYEKSGYQLIRFFENKENIGELVKRTENLKKEKKINESKKTESENREEKGIKFYLIRIFKFLF